MNKELGAKIKKCRQEKGLSREELSKKLEISIHTLSKYEQGQREPNIETLKKMSDALDVSINDLLETFYTDEEKKQDMTFEFWDKGINTYEKPTDAERHRHDIAIYTAVFNMLKDKDIQQEFNYVYDDLLLQETSSLAGFVLGMIKLKIDDINDIRITYNIKGVLKRAKEENKVAPPALEETDKK